MTTTKDSQFRLELFAQLALQRARLLNAMLGLDAEALETPLWDDYSIRRLLPHIGLWEGYEAERLSLINEGRLSEIGRMPVDERNAMWHAQHAETSIDGGAAILQKERNGLLNVVESVPDDLLKATVTLESGNELPVLVCVSSSVEHDEEHTDGILAWRESAGLNNWVAGPQSILLAAMRASRKALKAVLALVKDPTALSIDEWTIQEMMAHVASWELHVRIGLDAGGLGDISESAGDDEANAQLMAQFNDKSMDEIWQVYAGARKGAIEIVGGLNSAELATPFQTPWDDMPTRYHALAAMVAHDVQHADEIYGAYLVDKRTKK